MKNMKMENHFHIFSYTLQKRGELQAFLAFLSESKFLKKVLFNMILDVLLPECRTFDVPMIVGFRFILTHRSVLTRFERENPPNQSHSAIKIAFNSAGFPRIRRETKYPFPIFSHRLHFSMIAR